MKPALHRQRATRRLREFMANETAGGIVMLIAAALAMFLVNSPWHAHYHAMIDAELALNIGNRRFAMPFTQGVKDLLMPVFFLAIGMELKREMLEGFLVGRSAKILPLIAAAGGIAVPALIYLSVNAGIASNQAGWAIPTATDIAFAICVLRLVGPHVPPAAKIFLLAIAIYDDLAAIGIIALFYSQETFLLPLFAAVAIAGGMATLNRRGFTHVPVYLLLGIALGFCLHAAHIHPTVAGMITGLMIPFRTDRSGGDSPFHRLFHRLHPWVAFAVLPLFAFVSAGIDLSGITRADFMEPLPMGILLGLVVGKPLGIFGATWIAIRLGLATRPEGVRWSVLYGISLLAGIGFTMSLLIGQLAFPGHEVQNTITLGVIAGSLLSAAGGAAVLSWALRR